MTDPALRDRLAKIMVDAWPFRDIPPWKEMQEKDRIHWRTVADALLASEEWEAREAVVKCAQDLDEYMGSDASPTSVWLEFRAALARLAAMRGTT